MGHNRGVEPFFSYISFEVILTSWLYRYLTIIHFYSSLIQYWLDQEWLKSSSVFTIAKITLSRNNYGTIKQGRESVNLYGGVFLMSHYI